MPTLLDHHIAHDPDGIALTDESGAVSWSDLGERVNRWMRLFTQRGLDVGDRLACVIGNRREAFEVLLACLHTGVTAVPVNWHLTESEIAHILSDSDSRTVIVEDVYAETVTRAVLTAGTCKRSPSNRCSRR
jgi:acyl-CoA synthetase (AMP-forming)/AMP-acid ligase II